MHRDDSFRSRKQHMFLPANFLEDAFRAAHHVRKHDDYAAPLDRSKQLGSTKYVKRRNRLKTDAIYSKGSCPFLSSPVTECSGHPTITTMYTHSKECNSGSDDRTRACSSRVSLSVDASNRTQRAEVTLSLATCMLMMNDDTGGAARR